MNLGQILDSQEAKGYALDTRTARLDMVNSVGRRICNLRRWPWLKVLGATGPDTVRGTESYDITTTLADLQYIDAVSIRSTGNVGYDLEYLENEQYREFARITPNATTYGQPLYWTATGGTVYLYPKPDAAYGTRIDYLRGWTDLASDTDQPIIPTRYHDLLVWGTVAEMCFRERDNAGREVALDEYDKRLLEMMHQERMVQRQTVSRVVDSGTWVGYDEEWQY